MMKITFNSRLNSRQVSGDPVYLEITASYSAVVRVTAKQVSPFKYNYIQFYIQQTNHFNSVNCN